MIVEMSVSASSFVLASFILKLRVEYMCVFNFYIFLVA